MGGRDSALGGRWVAWKKGFEAAERGASEHSKHERGTQTRELDKHAAIDAFRRRMYCNLAYFFYLNVLRGLFLRPFDINVFTAASCRVSFARLYDASVSYDVVQRALPVWSCERLSLVPSA